MNLTQSEGKNKKLYLGNKLFYSVLVFVLLILFINSVSAIQVSCGTKQFDNGAQLRDFVNSLGTYTHIPNDTAPDTGALFYDSVTIAKACQLTGYPVVVSSEKDSYYSCSDDTLAYWDTTLDNFVIVNACQGYMIDKLVCEKMCNIVCGSNSDCNDNNDKTTDTCLNPGTVNSQCIHNSIISCRTNTDCNDNNAYTKDECNNPATTSSYCSHTTMNCITDNDCGSTGFIGNEFCFSNSVFKNFKTSKCVNPATTASYCNVFQNSQLINDCGSDSSCGNFGNNYCKGNNVYHSKNCFQNGCSNGACIVNQSSDEELVQYCNQNQICSNGMCNNQTINCTQNSNCGTDHFLNQLSCKNGNVFDKFTTFTCNNPGTTSSSCSSSTSDVLKQTCIQNQVCNNGQCVNQNIACCSDSQCDDYNQHTLDKCNNAGTQNSFCTHTPINCLSNNECGTNGFINGLFCTNNNVFQNFITYTCNNPGTPNSFCSNTTTSQLKQTCAQNQICSNGMCMNQTITCHQNSDCGINGFTGNTFCQNNNIFQNFITYTCNNAGTCSSFCSSTNNIQLKQNCLQGQTCSNGNCITPQIINCTTDSQCDDDNLYTVDKCNNPETSSSYCSHTVVNCVTNNDCGLTGFIGSEFCSNEDVFKINQTSTCVNPATTASYCQVFKTNVMIVDCGVDSCSNFGNNYCKGNNVYKNQSCVNNGCSLGSCFSTNNPFINETLVKSCSPGMCSNGDCLNQICSQNSDCGSQSQKLVCSGDDVIKVITTPICSNNSCSSSVINATLETCSYGCSNGVCGEAGDDRDANRVSRNSNNDYNNAPDVLTYNNPQPSVSTTSFSNYTNPVKITNLTQEANIKSNNYFWLVLLLVFIFVLLILILIVILVR